MSTDPDGGLQVNVAEWRSAVLGALRQSSNGGNGGLSAIRSVISKINLPPEQAMMVDLLFSLDEQADDSLEDLEGEILEGSVLSDNPENARDADTGGFAAELADLREVNDTLAAALGACPLCWGGDRDCECGGLGRAGSSQPDPDLFDEIVYPAVKRVMARRRAGRARSQRAEERSPARANRPVVRRKVYEAS